MHGASDDDVSKTSPDESTDGSRPGVSDQFDVPSVAEPLSDDDRTVMDDVDATRVRPFEVASPDVVPPVIQMAPAAADAYTADESITTRGPPVTLGSTTDDSVTARKPAVVDTSDASEGTTKTVKKPVVTPFLPTHAPFVGSDLGLAAGALGNPNRPKVVAPVAVPAPLSAPAGPPAARAAPAVPLVPSPEESPRPPRYGLLVALVGFVSFAVPVALFFWLHRFSDDEPDDNQDRGAAVAASDHVDRAAPSAVKKTAPPGPSVSASTSASAPPRSPAPPKRR